MTVHAIDDYPTEMLCLTRDLDFISNIQIYTPNKANHFSFQIIVSQQANKIVVLDLVSWAH